MGLSQQEKKEIQEYRDAKREEARKGQVDKRAVELGDELLRPIGLRVKADGPNGLTSTSRGDFHTEMQRVIETGQENALYERQKGWKK